MRRKKNADAQAAFRARRANYIASLEETGPASSLCLLSMCSEPLIVVFFLFFFFSFCAFRFVLLPFFPFTLNPVTSLEAVVLSLQDTCREARNDADDLRHENSRLQSVVEAMKQAARDREKQWRDFWQSKQQALGLDETHMNDLPPRASGTPPTGELHPTGGVNSRQYVDEAQLRFQTATTTHSNPTSGDTYPLGHGKEAADQRYPSSMQPFTANPEGNWIPGPFSNTRTPCVAGDPHPSQSSEASDSPPSISPVVQYSGRFPLTTDGDRMSLVNLGMPNAGYGRVSRSASTLPLVSDMLLYSLPEPGSLGVPDYATSEGYQHRHGLPESERYAGRPRRAYSGPNPRGGDLYGTTTDVPRVSSPSHMTPGESEGLNGGGGGADGHGALDVAQLRPRRHTLTTQMHGGGGSSGLPGGGHSRSSSPSPRDRDREPPMSNTLAVIKAQAFGSLRRTRTRTKKVADTGSKVAIDILCTRGIGMGVQSAPAPSHSSGSMHHRHSRRKGELDDVEMNS